MEIFNEIGINLFSFALYLLTPMVEDSDVRYLIGWFLVGLTSAVMASNILVVIIFNVKNLCNICINKRKSTRRKAVEIRV